MSLLSRCPSFPNMSQSMTRKYIGNVHLYNSQVRKNMVSLFRESKLIFTGRKLYKNNPLIIIQCFAACANNIQDAKDHLKYFRYYTLVISDHGVLCN